MTDNIGLYSRHRSLFENLAFSTFRDSPNPIVKPADWNATLLLGDRVYAASEGNQDLGMVYTMLPRALDTLAHSLHQSSSDTESIAHLLGEVERWYKWILLLAFPDTYSALKDPPKRGASLPFTLAETAKSLNVLLEEDFELPVHKLRRPNRMITFAIRSVIHARNQAVHGGELLDQPKFVEVASQTLIALLLPLVLHQDRLTQSLQGWVSSPLAEDKDGTLLIKAMASERRSHLGRFYGREDWLDRLLNWVASPDQDEGEYLVLTGAQGTGKSALVSGFSQRLNRGLTPLGSSAPLVTGTVPWLPGCLMFLGKQSSNPQEIIRSLTLQANTLLINELKTPALPEPDEGDPISSRYETPLSTLLSFSDSEGLGEGKKFWRNLEAPSPGKFLPAKRLSISHTPRIKPQPQRSLEHSFREILDSLIAERSRAVVIMDALDEIDPSGESLAFLPKFLPPEARVLLSCRADSRLINWLKRNRRVKILEMTSLKRQEIPGLTGVDDEEGPAHQQFNDEVFTKSQGWPLMTVEVGRLVREELGDFQKVVVHESVQSIHEHRASQWRTAGPLLSEIDPLQEILLLLALFEPVSPLTFAHIQAYLRSQGLEMRLPDIRNTMSSVSDQCEGMDADKIKLALGSFGEYLREKHFSDDDVLNGKTIAIKWIAGDLTIDHMKLMRTCVEKWSQDSKTIRALVDTFKNASPGEFDFIGWVVASPRRELTKPVFHFCQVMKSEGAPLGYIRLLKSMFEKEEFLGQNPSELAQELEHLASTGQTDAKRVLGEILLEGKNIEANRERGVEYLQAAVDEGDFKAAFTLGCYFLDYKDDRDSFDRGRDLLEMVIASPEQDYLTTQAKLQIALNLVYKRDASLSDHQEAERILKDLGASHPSLFLSTLGELYWHSEHLKDLDKAKQLLEEAFQHSPKNAIELGHFLINSPEEYRDLDRGIDLLESAPKNPELPLIEEYHLAKAYLNQALPCFQPEKGIQIADNLLDRGMTIAAHLLSEYFMDQPETKDRNNALLSVLNRGIELSDHLCEAVLGSWYEEGFVVPMELGKALELLRRAYEGGIHWAGTILGRLLCNEGLVEDDRIEGLQLLEEAARRGDSEGKTNLGFQLFYNSECDQDNERGLKLILEAANDGDSEAQYYAGTIRLLGIKSDPDPDDGENFLLASANQGFTPAQVNLSHYYLKNFHLNYKPREAVKLLKKAVESKNPDAFFDLGSLYFAGIHVPHDPANGEYYLSRITSDDMDGRVPLACRKILNGPLGTSYSGEFKILHQIAEQGGNLAQLELSRFLLDGLHCPQDIQKGMDWLKQAAHSGHKAARLGLAAELIRGLFIEPDHDEAQALLRECEKSYKVLGTDFAWFYLFPDWPKHDPEKGHAILLNKVKQGDVPAAAMLADYYLKEILPNKSAYTPRQLLDFGVERNHLPALVKLGDHLIQGKFIDQDIKEGRKLLTRAAKLRSNPAHLMLAGYYRKGRFGDPDPDKADFHESQIGPRIPERLQWNLDFHRRHF
jgi:TPR repeat protein